MDNLNKEDIDYIFKEGSKKHEFPFNESAWDNMELMLDEQDKKRVLFKWSAIGTILLVIGIASFFTFANDKSNTVKTSQTNESLIIAEETITTDKQIAKEYPNKNKKANDISSTSEVQITQVPLETKPLNNKINNTTDKTRIDSYESTNKLSSAHLPNQIYTRLNAADTKKSGDENKGISNISTPSINLEAKTLQKAVEAIAQEENIQENGQKNAIEISELPPIELSPLPITQNFEREPTPMIIPKTNRLSYQLILGKDWSSVGMMNKKSDGFRFGAGLAYQFGRRFQLSTGFVYSKKFYETEGTNYTPQPQFRWVDGVAPETVNGKCDIFEIPLDFTYYFKGFDKNSFFVSGGANTYLMNSEWYDLKFSDPDRMADPNIRKTISTEDVDNKCIHYFGIGMFSAGYQKYLTGNTAVQIGPYVQLPFTGIGMGSVDLVSAGVQVKVAFSK